MFDILEAESGKPFKIRGIFMKNDVTSKNGYHYSKPLVEGTVAKIQEAISNDGSYPISMMADHPGIAANKTLSVIGKVTAAYMDGNNAILEAELANTTVGKDVQELVKGGFVKGLSIRSSNAQVKSRNIGGKMVKDVLEMELKGVDLVVNPGVDGAKVTDIIESDESGSSNLYVSITEMEVLPEDNKPQDNINEEENTLNLQELKEKFPQLVESLQKEFKELMESDKKFTDLQESVSTLTGEKEGLSTSLQEAEQTINTLKESEVALKGKLEEAEGKLREIQESADKAIRESHIDTKLAELKYADSVKKAIRSKLEVLESVDKIDAVLESEVAFLDMVIKESTGVKTSGKGHTGDNKSDKSINESEDDEFMKLVDKY